MFRKQSVRVPKWAAILALVLLVATTALAAAQSPELHLPLITGEGEAVQEAPETQVEEPVGEQELPPDSAAQDAITDVGSTTDVPAPMAGQEEVASVAAFDATQWTVQNKLGVGTTAPAGDIDVARNVNQGALIQSSNSSTGNAALAHVYVNAGSFKGVALQQFGAGYTALTWGPLSLKNMARLRTSTSTAGLILTTGGAYPLILGTADIERMRITSAGKVGIGTTTPATRLSIAGGPEWTTHSWIGAIDLPNASAIAWHPNIAGWSFGMGHTTGGFHLFRTYNNPGTIGSPPIYELTISDIGYVGIGTTDPQNRLHVKGDTRIDGNLYLGGQQMIVPDYVFEPDYPLLSLDELRAYIAEEKHLPNVPNAEQIAQGGLNLNEFQMTLLEKTEELTLYTLAQDEQIETLQQIIADLETRLAALEERE